MLEHLTGDVQGQVFGVHQTLDKTEVIRQQVLAAIHDQHAVGVQLQALFVVLIIIVERCMLRNVQQGIVRNRTLVVHVDMAQRVGVVAALVPIEGVILLLGDLALILMPQRNHAVERYGFGVVLVFVRVLFLAALGHLHADGEADVIAIALDKALDAVLVKVLAVVLCAVAVLISCHIRQ